MIKKRLSTSAMLYALYFIIHPLDESRGYIWILMFVRPSHFWFQDNIIKVPTAQPNLSKEFDYGVFLSYGPFFLRK